MDIPGSKTGRGELDGVLMELRRLLTELKDSRENEELKEQIRRLFARANPLIVEIDGVAEKERINNSAIKIPGMASYLFVGNEPEVKEFLQLLGIPVEIN